MQTEVRAIDLDKTFVLQSTLNFTRYFFKKNFGKKFIVNHHHKIICDVLDRVIKGELTRVIFNVAPRYSKTEIVVKNFCAYGLALNPAAKFIHLSYSADLAMDNSKEVQETVTSEAFQELFEVELSTTSKKKWHTTAGGGMYAVSSGGQVTGFGAGSVDYKNPKDKKEDPDNVDLDVFDQFTPYFDSEFAGAIIIDDPIKPDDAQNDKARDAVNLKFDTTIRNRVNSRKTPIIIIMQRLHMNDLSGYLQKLEGVVEDGGEWTVIELPCLSTDPETKEEVALWPHKHTVEELHLMRLKNSFVFETQYQQNPKPKEGLMYERGFREYDVVPYTPNNIAKNYTDTADTGSDYLNSINYVQSDLGNFVTDILFTQKPMEYTEVKTAEMLAKDRIAIANIESNNGGRSFGRNVESQTRVIGNNITEFNLFHQSANKEVRIFSNSNEVQNITFFPRGWKDLWPEFYQHITTYMKTGNNKHDDGPDVLTGMLEMRTQSEGESAEGFFN